MLRHVVMFRFREEAPPDARDSVEAGLADLPSEIEEIESYRFGADLGLRDGNFDYCLVADFADEEAFARYVDHPAHQRFIAERLAPVVAERVSVQYTV
ncbi:MAG TPA: Dabb family protein [Myxococcota bacterium]|nr:Dabb family protein [Myxococcota bacterium]